MLLDARSIAPGEVLQSDVCIVGGGAAGISLALGLIDHPAQVIVLESGGVNAADAPQHLNEGTTTGRPYYPLDACRLRFLGGSTNFWGGWCRPLDALDFEEREWVPHSGWAFDGEHLEPYYRRAQALCGLGAYDYDPRHWQPRDRASLIPDESDQLSHTVFHIGPTRFGEAHRAALRRGGNIRVIVHGNAVEIEMDPSHRVVTRIRAATMAGNEFAVRARIFVLAAGGIENPRILLASRRARDCGVGNERDLVGRFFADHLHVPVGILRPRKGGVSTFYEARRVDAVTVRGGIALTERVRRRERLLGCALTLHNADDPHDVWAPATQPDGYQSFRVLLKSAWRRERPARLWHHLRTAAAGIDDVARLSYRRVVKPAARTLIVGCRAEQVPNPESRVTLDERRDRLGMPRVRLHWQLAHQDMESFTRAQKIWAGELDRNQVDVVPFCVSGDDRWADRVAAGAHHTGTTRMHRDPQKGVVDEHCRVHGTSNLYAAGSSVFPTAGWAPPTLTIVALALRLADHCRHRLSNS